MAQFIVNEGNSYTLVISTETGNSALFLSQDLTNTLAESGASAADPGAILEAMGSEAALYLEAMGSLLGMGDDLSRAFAEGGIGALGDALSEMGNSAGSDKLDEAMANRPGAGMLPDGFESASADTLMEMLGAGIPQSSGPDGGSSSGEEDAGGVLEGILGNQSHLMDGGEDTDNFGRVLEAGAKGAATGAVVGAVVGTVSPDPVTTVGGAAVGAVVGFVAGVVSEGTEVMEENLTLDSDDSSMPAGPDEEEGLSRAEFHDLLGDELDPFTPDPTTTMPTSSDGDFGDFIPVDLSGINDLDETTQPGTTEDAMRSNVDLNDFDEGLDPLINPGFEPSDEFDFGAFDGDIGGIGGGDDFALVTGGLAAPVTGEIVAAAPLAEAEVGTEPLASADEFMFG